MYIHIYVCIYLNEYVYVHACMYMYMQIFMYTYMYRSMKYMYMAICCNPPPFHTHRYDRSPITLEGAKNKRIVYYTHV